TQPPTDSILKFSRHGLHALVAIGWSSLFVYPLVAGLSKTARLQLQPCYEMFRGRNSPQRRDKILRDSTSSSFLKFLPFVTPQSYCHLTGPKHAVSNPATIQKQKAPRNESRSASSFQPRASRS